MPSSRHTVAVPNEEFQRLVLYCPSKGWITERLQGRQSIPFIVTTLGTGQREAGIYKQMGTAPRMSTICLFDIIRSPRPPPAVFHTGNKATAHTEILAVGKAWERS